MKVGAFLLGAAAGIVAYKWYMKNKTKATSPAANVSQALEAFIANVEHQAKQFSDSLKNYKLNIPSQSVAQTVTKSTPILNM